VSIRGEGIGVHFRGVKAIDDVDIVLRPGEILGLIGPNGAGKTTMVNALTGFVSPTKGTLWIGDRNVTDATPNQLAKMGVGRTFQSVRLFRGMTVHENVAVGGLGIGLPPRVARAQAEELLERLGLANRSNWDADALSFGEEQRLAIARALATRPKYLFLDEPAAGLNEVEGNALAHLIRETRNERDCSVMLIEHDMRVVLGLCDRIQVLDEGQTIGIGTPSEIQANDKVIRAYLGTRRFRASVPPQATCSGETQ
jgi:ABC-type branched-subunit amino acid transport system ATPase component